MKEIFETIKEAFTFAFSHNEKGEQCKVKYDHNTKKYIVETKKKEGKE